MRLIGCLVALATVCAPGCAPPCSSATCLAEEAVRDWPTDAGGVVARVRAIEDEFTRTAVIGRLNDIYPGATVELCPVLPEGPSRHRCERLNQRPHLSVVPGAQVLATSNRTGEVPWGRAGSTGATSDQPPPAPTSSFPDVTLAVPTLTEAVPDPCVEAADRSACLDHAATSAAISGAVARAHQLCGLHTDSRWAAECRFTAAEEAVRTRRAEAYSAAAILCGAAEPFAQECWAHTSSRLPRVIPPPNARPNQVRAATQIVARIRSTWTPAGADVAEAHASRFWAFYFANVYRHAKVVDGTPLDQYPADAAPHIRAAAAVRLQALGQLRGGLDARVDALRTALALRQPPGPDRGGGPDLVFVPDLGAPATAGPTTYFLGAPRRAMSNDETEDLRFCVIEAAARGEGADRAVVEEAARSADPRLSAEAARLLAAIATRE